MDFEKLVKYDECHNVLLTTKAIKKKLKHDKIQTGTGNPDA